MKPEISKVFKFEDVEIKIEFRFCEKSGKYIGEYPDFEEAPLFVKSGKRIVTAFQDKCEEYSSREDSVDCGSCDYYKTEKDGDLIGMCVNENMGCKKICKICT